MDNFYCILINTQDAHKYGVYCWKAKLTFF
jgi:hypothetical protein